MPVSPEVLTYIRSAAVALLGVVVATLSILAVGVFGDYFEAYPVHMTIMLTKTFGVDVLGAVIPLALACLSSVAFSKLTKLPLRKLAMAFPLSALLAFALCRQTADGVAGLPLLYAFFASVIAAGVTLYTKPRTGLKASLASSLSLTLFCVPLSIFTVDLAYAPFFCCSHWRRRINRRHTTRNPVCTADAGNCLFSRNLRVGDIQPREDEPSRQQHKTAQKVPLSNF